MKEGIVKLSIVALDNGDLELQLDDEAEALDPLRLHQLMCDSITLLNGSLSGVLDQFDPDDQRLMALNQS